MNSFIVNFDLIIFDCDGVLVDSEVISCRAHADVLSRHGYPITQQQVFDRFLGRSTRQAQFGSRSRTRPRPARRFSCAVAGRAVPVVRSRSAKPCRTFTRALDAIDPGRLRRVERIAPAHDPSRLGRAGLYDRFAPNIFSASQVSNGKPAPDLFLFAASQMNVAPERCLVIEDSVPGVTGGRAAGMTVLGFHGGSHCRPGHGDSLRAAGADRDIRRYAAIARVDRADWGCREAELASRHSGAMPSINPESRSIPGSMLAHRPGMTPDHAGFSTPLAYN